MPAKRKATKESRREDISPDDVQIADAPKQEQTIPLRPSPPAEGKRSFLGCPARRQGTASMPLESIEAVRKGSKESSRSQGSKESARGRAASSISSDAYFDRAASGPADVTPAPPSMPTAINPLPPSAPRAHTNAPRPRPLLSVSIPQRVAAVAHVLQESPKHLASAICNSPKIIRKAINSMFSPKTPSTPELHRGSMSSLMDDSPEGAAYPEQSPVRGAAGPSLRGLATTRKAGSSFKKLLKSQKESDKQITNVRRSSSKDVAVEKKPVIQRSSSKEANQRSSSKETNQRSSSKESKGLKSTKSLHASVMPMGDAGDEADERKTWSVSLVRLAIANARRNHLQRPTVQARVSGEVEFHAGLALRECITDIQKAVRAVFIAKHFIELATPSAPRSSQEEEAPAVDAADAWLQLLADVDPGSPASPAELR